MLTPEQVDQYHSQGYVIPDFQLETRIVDDLKTRHAALLQAHPEYNDYCGALLIHDLAFLNIARNESILDMVAQLIGPDIAIWNASLFAKPAFIGTRTPWHQDGEYWPIEPLATCSVWIALDDATRDNGCLRFLPGSHASRTLAPHHFNRARDIALPLELDAASYNEDDAVYIELKAGQISLHDVYLMHGSEANRTAHPRRGMTLRYMPTTSIYRRDRNKSPVDDQRPVFLMRGEDKSQANDFRVR